MFSTISRWHLHLLARARARPPGPESTLPARARALSCDPANAPDPARRVPKQTSSVERSYCKRYARSMDEFHKIVPSLRLISLEMQRRTCARDAGGGGWTRGDGHGNARGVEGLRDMGGGDAPTRFLGVGHLHVHGCARGGRLARRGAGSVAARLQQLLLERNARSDWPRIPQSTRTTITKAPAPSSPKDP